VARKLTVKLYGLGVVAKEEKRSGSESTSYYRRRGGQFIYSRLDFLNGAFGLIPTHLDGYESTLDLPAFDFIGDADPRWFFYYVSRPEFYRGHLGLANGGRKARRVNPTDLLRVQIDYPQTDAQRAIADAIDTAVAVEQAYEAELRALKAERQVLMADLLTGKRRVRVRVGEAAA
jgi:type I restriction enzyme S subunit